MQPPAITKSVADVKTLCFQLILTVLYFCTACATLVAQQSRLLQPEDLFRLSEFRGLRLSPDGKEIIFTTSRMSLEADRNLNTVWRVTTDGKSEPRRLTDNDKDGSPQWSPDGNRVAFISTRSGSAQLWILNLQNNDIQKVTELPNGVSSFSWSPVGNFVALTARNVKQDSYEQAMTKKEKQGVVIDKNKFSFFQLIRNQIFLDLENPVHLWILNLDSNELTDVTKDRHVDGFAWSPDGQSVVLTVRATPEGSDSAIVVWSAKDRSMRQVLGSGNGQSKDISYSSPFWSPDSQSLAVIYRDDSDRWAATGRIGIYSLKDQTFSLISSEGELEFYNPTFTWLKPEEIYIENTYQAGRRLFSLTRKGVLRPIVNDDAYNNEFTFAADGNKVAFVRQTLQQPPEIHIADSRFTKVEKLTSLNSNLKTFQPPEVDRISWTSNDGQKVEGWLFNPLDSKSVKPYPLLVMVHGGPTFVVSNRYEPYSGDRGGWIWPYPFRLFAQRGYAVFIPNYRGTGSYGKGFRRFSDEFKEPADDIISGISFLIKKGIADPKLIGIMGQSHGALLGPNLMAHHRIFKASSFAEGFGNFITSYAYVPGQHNLRIGEYYAGGDPYNNPERYIERSSIFHFKDLTTATLLEYGEQSAALLGLEMLSSLWRQGVPHEMVIYPKTGHNLASPVLQLESINRNLDWFDYWMLGKKNPSAKSQEQYARWEKVTEEMKAMRARNSNVKTRPANN